MREYCITIKKCTGLETYTIKANTPEDVVEFYLKYIHVKAQITKVTDYRLADISVKLMQGKRCPSNYYSIQFIEYLVNEKETEEQKKWTKRETLISKEYINSGAYRKKFDVIADGNTFLARTLYQYAKEMLQHRSGSEFEDMLWFDMIGMKPIDYAKDEKTEREIYYSESRENLIRQYANGQILTMHTHPNSSIPSPADYNSYVKHHFALSFVLCHNGQIFQYSATRPLDEQDEKLYNMYVNKYMQQGCQIGIALESACNQMGYIAAKEVL